MGREIPNEPIDEEEPLIFWEELKRDLGKFAHELDIVLHPSKFPDDDSK